jgi:hypothetical protein
MKNTHYTFLILSLTLLCMLGGCRKKQCHDPKNPECENYDPCFGKKRINANFRVRPGDNGFPPPEEWCDLVPCDTLRASSARFDLPLNNPSNSTYTWQVGSEPIDGISTGNHIYLFDNVNQYCPWGGKIDLKGIYIEGKYSIGLPFNNTEQKMNFKGRKLK